MNHLLMTLICYACWMTFYVVISCCTRIRHSWVAVYKLRKINNVARHLWWFAVIFVLVLVPIQALFTARVITYYWK